MHSVTALAVLDGKYQLIRQLGQGGMGAVYEARHTGTGRRVAVKVIVGEALAKSADVVARFRREAMASGSIESQHIAQVLDTGVDPASGSPYMVMELLLGEDIQQAIHRVGPLPPEIALRVAAQACLGLQKAHDAGVVHRDIKPANLFLARRDGGELVVKLLDFGIAKLMVDQLSSSEDAGLTRTGSMLGSPLYMSPEQARGKKSIDHRTDVWSLGVVLFEALTGTTPHGHIETLGELIIYISMEAPRNVQELAPWVSPEVAAIVHGALALDPNQRFASAQVMFDAIRPLLQNGLALADAMITPLPQTMRAVVAPRYLVESALRAPAPMSAQRLSLPDASGSFPTQASTADGLAHSQAGAPRSKRSGALVATSLALVVLASSAGTWRLTHHTTDASATRALAPSNADPAGSPSPAIASPAPAPPPTARTVRLAIAPDKVHVEVDGAEATPDHGVVEISGSLGSSHHVRLSLGKSEMSSDVAIAQDGPVPAKLELLQAGAHASRVGGARNGPSPAAAAPASAAAPAIAAPAPAPRPAPAAAPTAPSVSRDFN